MYDVAAKKITIIPARAMILQSNTQENKMIVCAYARVSTRKEEQEDSYETQVNYYTNKIKSNHNWRFGGMYADKGITGTKALKRPEFMKMIELARQHKIDRILVKNVSRFGRNLEESIKYIKELKELGVGVTFEGENIDTLQPGGEVLLAILMAMAEQEARNIGGNVSWALRSKFKRGEIMYNFSQTLGYTKDDNGNFVIVPKEAKIVKRIYREFLSGYSAAQIANGLMADGILPASHKEPKYKEWTEEDREKRKSRTKWYPSTIIQMLQNEKYKGCCQCQKTYKVDILSSKRRKNNGEIESAYLENSHPAIISKEMWDMVQAEFERRNSLRTFAGTGIGRYSSKYPMSGYIICGNCGSKHRRHAKFSKDKGKEATWVCINHKINGNDACSMQYVLEEDIKISYLKALSKISKEFDRIKETLIENIKVEVDDRLIEEMDKITETLEIRQEEMLHLTKALNKREISESAYNSKVIELSKEMDNLILAQRERQNKRDTIKLAKSRIHEMEEIVSQIANSDEFDEEIFKCIIDTITIEKSRMINFKFRCGIEVEEAI